MGVSTDEGFVVLEDSRGPKAVRASLSEGQHRLRQQLIETGGIVIEGETIRFSKDILFKSPSAAAAVVAGSSWNGRNQAWRDAHGTTLGALEEALLNASGPRESPCG